MSGHTPGLLDTLGRRNRKHADKDCEQCGERYRPRKASSRYCSRPCAWANNGGHNIKPETWWTSEKGYRVGRVWEDGKQHHVRHHRLVMERHLGRRLQPNEDVHHINGDRLDNRIENLWVIDHSEHATLSNKARWAAQKDAVNE